MSRITPPLNASGLFLLRSPFVTNQTTVYHVGALRNFEDLIREGEDPVKTVYAPVGLGDAEYQADKAAGAAVVTLFSLTEKPINVPDTYIVSYPDLGVVPHSWVVLSISCGMLADVYDTSALVQSVTDAVSDHTGVAATVKINRAPVTEAITQDQYVQNANARQAAIKLRDSVYANAQANLKKIADLTQSNAQFVVMIQALQDEITALKGTPP